MLRLDRVFQLVALADDLIVVIVRLLVMNVGSARLGCIIVIVSSITRELGRRHVVPSEHALAIVPGVGAVERQALGSAT